MGRVDTVQPAELASVLVESCTQFLAKCGCATPRGIQDPWLEYEESYKRCSSFGVQHKASWADANTYAANGADQQYELSNRMITLGVAQALRSGRMHPNRIRKRLEEIGWSGEWPEIQRASRQDGLDRALAATNRRLLSIRDRITKNTVQGARLQELVRKRRFGDLRDLVLHAHNETNLLTPWKKFQQLSVVETLLRDTAFAPAFLRALGEFVLRSTDRLDSGSFEEFCGAMDGAWARADARRAAKLRTKGPFIRAYMTFWLSQVNPTSYLYLAKDQFTTALCSDREIRQLPFTAEKYERVLGNANRVTAALAEHQGAWAPRDLIDLQTLLHLHFHQHPKSSVSLGVSGDRAHTSSSDRSLPISAAGGRVLGQPYVKPEINLATSEREPFEVDPDAIDRGTKGHARTQNHLARCLREHGIKPRSPVSGEPMFDLGWHVRRSTYVAEVKSLTTENEEKQLRLGLGQVLRYRHALSARWKEVVAVLAVERQPVDKSWPGTCEALGVVLLWPDGFKKFASGLAAKR